jgi:hypothetical protein
MGIWWPLVMIFLICTSANSQPKMDFPTTTYDFGTFQEAEGKKTHTFYLTNTGDQSLVIQNIVPSCGCTTPEWTKTPVPPKGKGTITAIFDPSGRGGTFSKTLTVYTNSKPAVAILTLKGEVIARVKSVEEIYSWPVGQIRFENNEILFASVVKTRKKIRVMPVINNSREPVKVEFTDLSPHLFLKMAPGTLKPGQKGLVECTYYGTKDSRWGNVRDMVKVKLNGVIQEQGIYVSANLVEDFSTLTREELANAPLMVPLSTRYDIGPMDQLSGETTEFKLRNDGGRDLIIRDIRPSCDCTSLLQGSGLRISPGGTGVIKLKFSSGNFSGSITRSVYIYSNDPKNSQVILLIHADVKPSKPVKK